MSSGAAGLSCCLHSECLLTGWIKGSGRLPVLQPACRGTSQELERGGAGHRRSTRAASLVYGDTSLWRRMKLHGGVWCTLVLVLGSRTSNPHLLLAQAQAQAAPGIHKTGNNPENRAFAKFSQPSSMEQPFEPHKFSELHQSSLHRRNTS